MGNKVKSELFEAERGKGGVGISYARGSVVCISRRSAVVHFEGLVVGILCWQPINALIVNALDEAWVGVRVE